MRWLILTDDHPPMASGIATFVERVAGGLAARGHEVQVAARHHADRRAIVGTRWIAARGPSFGRYSGRWLAGAAAVELVRADRVLATTWVTATVATRVRRDIVVTAHGSDVTRPAVRSERTFARVWRRAGRRLALSGHLARTLAARGVEAEILPAPVVLSERPAIRPWRARWGFVGRLTALKGVDRFVRWVAAAGVSGRVVGDGPERPALRRLAQALGADVRFVGTRSSEAVARSWSDLDLLVLAPRTRPDGSGAEGLGLALLEAAAHGVPVVGCKTGGVPEAVGPGLLVADPDDPAACAAQIREWWSPERGRAAWAWVREHHGTSRTLGALERGGEPR